VPCGVSLDDVRQDYERRCRTLWLGILSSRNWATRKLEVFVSAERISRRLNRVLIVSNDDDLNLLLPFLLETDGVQVSVARTPNIAMQALLRHSPEAIFFGLDFQDGDSLSFLEFVQEACPEISIFTVVRPECLAQADKCLQAMAQTQGCLLTPVDYRGVKTLLAGGSTGHKQRPLLRKDDPVAFAAN
jgi:CheY-like chemotaxis protein